MRLFCKIGKNASDFCSIIFRHYKQLGAGLELSEDDKGEITKRRKDAQYTLRTQLILLRFAH
jgi:hypothetical protein